MGKSLYIDIMNDSINCGCDIIDHAHANNYLEKTVFTCEVGTHGK